MDTSKIAFCTKYPDEENLPKQTEKLTETARLQKISSPSNYVEKLVFYTMEYPDKSPNSKKKIPISSTLENIPVFKKRARTSKNNYGPF